MIFLFIFSVIMLQNIVLKLGVADNSNVIAIRYFSIYHKKQRYDILPYGYFVPPLSRTVTY